MISIVEDNLDMTLARDGNEFLYGRKEIQDKFDVDWYDSGARYQTTSGIFSSIDPQAEKYYGISPYAYCSDNPVNLFDPDGRAGHAIINQDNRTITISSTYIFYGSKATPELSAKIANEIAWQYNGANGSVQIDGIKYAVNFDIHYQTVTEEQATEMAAGNTDASRNFVRVEETNSRMNRSFFELSDNTGFMNTTDNLGTSTTAPHEAGHGYGLDHPNSDQRGNGQPGIMAARGTAVDAGYTYNPQAGDSKNIVNSSGRTTGYSNSINPQTRRVTPQNISDMFKNIIFRNGAANIGHTTNRIYDANGYEKNNYLNTFLIQCLFISLFSCTSNVNNKKAVSIKLDKENSELVQQWKKDSLGCENMRSKALAEKIIASLKLESTPKDNFIQIFGTPNVVRNYEGKIILCYYFNSSCADGTMLKDADTCLAEFTFKDGKLSQRSYICN